MKLLQSLSNLFVRDLSLTLFLVVVVQAATFQLLQIVLQKIYCLVMKLAPLTFVIKKMLTLAVRSFRWTL